MLEIPSKHAPKIDDLAWDKDNDSLAILTVRTTFPEFKLNDLTKRLFWRLSNLNPIVKCV